MLHGLPEADMSTRECHIEVKQKFPKLIRAEQKKVPIQAKSSAVILIVER